MGRQIDKIRRRFGLERVALAGDRGMAASARIREELVPAGLDWISALKSTDIRKLAKGPPAADVPIQDAVAEIASPDFPGERLMVCLSPAPRRAPAQARRIAPSHGKRLEEIARIVRRRGSRLRGKEDIARRVGDKVSKHFETIGGLSWRIDREAAHLGGSLGGHRAGRGGGGLQEPGARRAGLPADQDRAVEGAADLRYSEAHVRARVFLCMLAY